MHIPKNDKYYIEKIINDFRIVHDYGNVDLNIIYSTLTNDIPELLVLINPKA